MEDWAFLGDSASVNVGREEEEDDFCSCCEDEAYEEETWRENEEPVVEGLKDELDEFSVKMFFKGLSISGVENSSSCFSGIGVFMERSSSLPAIRMQKKLDFYAEESVIDYLALMDGLQEAVQNKIRRVYAFMDLSYCTIRCGHEFGYVRNIGMANNHVSVHFGMKITLKTQ